MASVFLFFMILGILGFIYFFFSKILNKNKKCVPFVPLILFAFLLFWFLRYNWV
jgi:hypothetical protein